MDGIYKQGEALGMVKTRGHDMRRYNWYYVVVCSVCTMYGVFEKYCGKL